MNVESTMRGGIYGALMMTLVGSVFRVIGIFPVTIEFLAGTMVITAPLALAWTLGFVAHIIAGVAFAHFYAFFFELTGRSSGVFGAVLGLGHAVMSGLALSTLGRVHPNIPEVVQDPQVFMLGYGPDAASGFILLHLLFGAIVGTVYRPGGSAEQQSALLESSARSRSAA